MARITVEDCLGVVPNPFELVLLAAQRARSLAVGADPTIERDDDKNTVLALREISARSIRPSVLRDALVESMCLRSRDSADVVPGTSDADPASFVAADPDGPPTVADVA